jgi:predicted dehydrogenase/threonine dehydrogenase-like Zn-dependent dehydrogenase
MKQVLIRKGTVFVEQVPRPVIERDHVLVEVAYSVISPGTELAGIRSSGQSLLKRAAKNPEKALRVLKALKERGIRRTIAAVGETTGAIMPTGYSCSGIVIQVGEGVTTFAPGDEVACAGAGWANHAELVLVPKNLVCKVPSGCDLAEAASVTLGAIALQGVRRADPTLGETGLVLGVGLLGLLTIQLLVANGCHVVAVDPQQERVDLASTYGAHAAHTSVVDAMAHLNAATAGHGADFVIITASAPGNSEPVQQAVAATRKKGKVVIVGDIGLDIDRTALYAKEGDLLISTSYGPGRYDTAYEEQGHDYPRAYVRWTENRNMQAYLGLLAGKKVQFTPLVGSTYAVDDAVKAYEALSQPDRPLAVLLDYQQLEGEAAEERLRTRIDLGAASQPRSGQRVRVAVVGAGEFARAVHLPNLQSLQSIYDVSAIVSSTGAKAKHIAKQVAAAYATTDYSDVLKDKDIDMVLIATRHHLHARMAIEAARSGKAIFLEKPMALTSEELEALTSVLAETGSPFMIGYNRRFSPAAQLARRLLVQTDAPAVITYRVNAGHIPAEHWIQGSEGGGRILGEACHMIDLLRYLVGHPLEEMAAVKTSISTESPDDNVIAALKYADGSVATLVYTSIGNSAVPKEWIEIHSGGGTITIDDFKNLQSVGMGNERWEGKQDKGHLEGLKVFGETVLKGDPSPIPLSELVETTRATLLLHQGEGE